MGLSPLDGPPPVDGPALPLTGLPPLTGLRPVNGLIVDSIEASHECDASRLEVRLRQSELLLPDRFINQLQL